LVVKSGSSSFEDLIKEISNGIYIDAFAWLNPNAVTGTFGAEIRTAYMIENGEIGRPIKGGNLSGNVYDMVKNVSGISNETDFISKSKVPWMSFKNLTLSGNKSILLFGIFIKKKKFKN
jgi:PmbA protein